MVRGDCLVMKTIKSYSKIWNAEGTLYSVGDTNLPFPLTYTQIIYFIASFLLMFALGDVPPFSFIDNWLLKNVAIPVVITFLLSKLEFDGKKPWEFLLSYISYWLRPKITYGGRAIGNKRVYVLNFDVTVKR